MQWRGVIFVLETLSVILQVGSFKIRKKRIFLMAPLHHHFEIKGWSESKIIVRFWMIALLANIIALILCFPGSRKIDMTLIATEYRFNDPDYAVEHTVTIRGYDTRNLLGRGNFKGTFAINGWETARKGWTAYVQFPIRSGSYFNMNFNDPSGQAITRSPFSATTMERSFSRSLSAIRPPSKPSTMENGPVMSRLEKTLRR